MRIPRAGFTLAETLVSAGLGLLLLGIMLALWLAGRQLWSLTSNRSELQQRGLLAIERMVDDLSGSAPAGVVRADSRMAVTPVQDVTAEGSLAWDNRTTVYFERADTLWRRHVSNPTTGRLPGLSPGDLEALTLVTGAEERPLCRDVESLTVGGSGGLVQLELRLARALPRGEVLRCRLLRSVWLRTP